MKAEQETNATRAVNPRVLCAGKGFAVMEKSRCPLTKVVQSHRRLRHIAPGSFFGKLIGAGRNSCGTATNPLAPRGIATELDRCQTGVSCGLAAAHLRFRHSGGAERSGRHRVSQTAGARPGTVASFCRKSNRAACSRRDSGPVRRKIQNFHHGDTEESQGFLPRINADSRGFRHRGRPEEGSKQWFFLICDHPRIRG